MHAPPSRSQLLHRGVLLERLTIGWNLAECAIAVLAGWLAGSIALVGFGLDSLIEVVAGWALLHRLRAEQRGAGEAESERRERRALGIVGVTFFLLALYVLIESGRRLWGREAPAVSAVGMVLAGLSLAVMPLLAWAKIRTGRALGSRALLADAKETLACSYLSATLLAGLALNATLGWWWADPAAALLMTPWLLHEGWEALEAARGHEGCDGLPPAATP